MSKVQRKDIIRRLDVDWLSLGVALCIAGLGIGAGIGWAVGWAREDPIISACENLLDDIKSDEKLQAMRECLELSQPRRSE